MSSFLLCSLLDTIIMESRGGTVYFFQKNVGIENFERDPLVRSMNFSKPLRRKCSKADFRDFGVDYQRNKYITSILPNITFVLPKITLGNRLVAE